MTIGSGVTSIGDKAFSNCDCLGSVTIYATSVPTLGSAVFNRTSGSYPKFYVFSDCVEVYKAVWGGYANDIEAIAPEASGTCGKTGSDNVEWQVAGEAGNYRLIISGTGEMADYASANDVPWAAYLSSITTAAICDGVTAIGSNAFNGCENLTNVTLYGAVTIGSDAIPVTATVTIANGLYLYNGSEVLSGTITNMTKVNGKTLRTDITVSYVKADGTTDTHQATMLTGNETTLDAGWYVVISNITYTGKITLDGDVNIILCDGKTMIANGDSYGINGSSDGTLTIYGQALGTGTLNATGTVTNGIGIVAEGTITINGGTVNANGTGEVGIRSVDGVTINRGTVTTTGIMADGNVTINGGKVTSTEAPGISSNSGSITLSWTSPDDRICAPSYAGNVTIASGKAFTTDGTDIYSGTLSSDDLTAIAGKTLVPQTETFYQRVTDVSQLESGKRYFIVAKKSETYYAWAGFSFGMATATKISANSSGIITSVGNAAHMQLVQSGEKWKIIDCSTNQYVGVIDNANMLQESSDSDSDTFLWDISFDGSGTLKVHIGEKYLKFIKNIIRTTAFSIYGESQETDISLYKEVLIPGTSLTLYDGIDNTAVIGEAATIGGTFDVTLKNRVLYKDGDWNTLCLPFALTAEEIAASPMAGATIMELDTEGIYEGNKTGLVGTTLYLYFKTAESIEAGMPYLVCWGTPESNPGGSIVNPLFNTVTITSTEPTTVTSDDGKVSFIGNYIPVDFAANDKSVLFLGTNNTLHSPKSSAKTMNAFRAYFQLSDAMSASTYVLSFGEGNETTGIIDAPRLNNKEKIINNKWYDLQGRKLSTKPTAKGVYVNNGKKYVIK